MKNRMINAPEGSFFLFGPRGSGKSMWLQARFPDASYVNLLEPDVRRRLLAHPEHLNALVDAAPADGVFVIDEIQHVPALLDVVHAQMEKHRDLRFVMTGSSARKLRRAGHADLLGGRAVKCMCHPFLAAEMGEDFNLESALTLGMVPLVRYPNASDSGRVLATYLDLYMQEEILNEGLIRNLESFSRFLEAASFSHASVLSSSAIARDAEIKRSTVDGYFAILEEMLVAERLPVFTKRARREMITHSKFYFFDCGVYRALRPKGPLDAPAEIDGAALEGLVFQQLRAWLDYSGVRNGLYFWRTRTGSEVDFIVYAENIFAAIEVKNAAKVSPRDLTALKAFHSDYPEAQPILLYRGTERYQTDDGISIRPVEDFLRGLVSGSELPK